MRTLGSTLRRTSGRPLAAGAVVALLVACGLVVAAANAGAPPKLPSISRDALVTSVVRQLAADPTISGDVATHADLGLPSLGDTPYASLAGSLTDVLGDHHLRVWRSPDGLRAAELLSPAAERSIWVSKAGAWYWDSETNTATHLNGPLPTSRDVTRLVDPVQMTRWLLGAVGSTTTVSLGADQWVAGRATYQLVLTPNTSATLVGHVSIDVDATHRLPLRIALYARGARTAAVAVSYTSVRFSPIAASAYHFTPPPGAKVVQAKVPAHRPSTEAPDSGSTRGDMRVFGTGWTSVLAVRVPTGGADGGNGAKGLGGLPLGQLLPYSGSLFSARLVQRGDHAWILVGAVPQSALSAVAPKLS